MNKGYRSLWLIGILTLLTCLAFAAPASAQSTNAIVVVNDDLFSPVQGASVYIDETYMGLTNYDGSIKVSNFTPGMHKITAKKEGLQDRVREYNLQSGVTVQLQMKRVTTSISPDIVTFIIREDSASKSIVAGASIYIDNQLAGTTDTRDGKLQIELTEGIHEISVHKSGMMVNTSTIDVKHGQTYMIALTPGKTFSIFDGELFIYSLEKEVTKGLVTTLELSIIAMAIGLVIGLIMGLGRTSTNILFRGIASIYVEGIRGLPLLLQLLFVNFGLPFLIQDLTGGSFNIDGFTACIVALSMNSGAYMAEIFKAGIEAIHKGQMEAARSLGMSHYQAMTFIILPQAFKIVLPALGNEFIALIKDSSIGLVISVSEVLWWSKTVGAEHYNTFTPLLAAGLVYLCITIPLGRIVQYMEKKYNVNARKGNLPAKKKKTPQKEATV
ncbi:ABC transporter permease subunit [Methanocella arvoryzae]|uniref:ABC-type glutamate import system, permease component n=1 Tax=Methanocella arvoryzae (strain DSM 22066 / NBRC 105507 / MRE50) TaxID=351160 RepID=Q0W7K4_METAR|nr:ABC transporter permease subunit [Methanocella arvoryzae]CAJ35639.1 ABC-type glutamate import system, permease component [Methanocella arvoryzae MRE50]